MVSTICWSCGVHSNLTPAASVRGLVKSDGTVWTATFSCDACGELVIARALSDSTDPDPVPHRHAEDVFYEYPTHWLPSRAVRKSFSGVPAPISAVAEEAFACVRTGLYRAGVAMARATIEATAKDKGSTTGNLQAKIKALHDNGHIRAYVKESADNVRHFGNDSVHGEVTTPITEEEAELVIALMIRVLDEVYQGPAEVQEAERMLAERKARGKG